MKDIQRKTLCNKLTRWIYTIEQGQQKIEKKSASLFRVFPIEVGWG